MAAAGWPGTGKGIGVGSGVRFPDRLAEAAGDGGKARPGMGA